MSRDGDDVCRWLIRTQSGPWRASAINRNDGSSSHAVRRPWVVICLQSLDAEKPIFPQSGVRPPPIPSRRELLRYPPNSHS